MPEEQTAMQEIDVFKSLVYKLCDFLIQKRQTFQGRGLRTVIPVLTREMCEYVFEYIHNTTEETKKITQVEEALCSLLDEKLPNGSDFRPLITLQNEGDLETFSESFEEDRPLNFIYTSRDLEEYKSELIRRTEALRNTIYGATVTPKNDGGVTISFEEKEMKVRRGRGETQVSANLVKLLYGLSVHGNSIPSYERGNHIDFTSLESMLLDIHGQEENDDFIEERAVKDALRRLNKRSISKLEKSIFNINDEGVSWIL